MSNLCALAAGVGQHLARRRVSRRRVFKAAAVAVTLPYVAPRITPLGTAAAMEPSGPPVNVQMDGNVLSAPTSPEAAESKRQFRSAFASVKDAYSGTNLLEGEGSSGVHWITTFHGESQSVLAVVTAYLANLLGPMQQFWSSWSARLFP